MLLEGKTAVVYGASGSIWRAVSRAFARDGVRLFLTGRTALAVSRVMRDIECPIYAAINHVSMHSHVQVDPY